MADFKKEKGKVVMSTQVNQSMRITIHRGTSAEVVKMLSDAIEKAKKPEEISVA